MSQTLLRDCAAQFAFESSVILQMSQTKTVASLLGDTFESSVILQMSQTDIVGFWRMP